MSDGAIFISIIAAIVAAILVFIGLPVWIGTYYSQRSYCHNFGSQTGREVKFRVLVRAVAPIKWECLTKTQDGKWIPTKNLRELGERP